MKSQRNRKLTTITLILALTFSISLTGIASVSAQTVSFFYVMAAPNPVGVNQDTLITIQMSRLVSYAPGFQCDAIDPDGETIHLFGPESSNPVAAAWFYFTPTKVGNYTLTGSWPGNSQYAASEGSLVLVVQEEPISNLPSVPLPTDSWKRPIYGENKGWWEVADSWLMFSYDRTDKPERRQSVFAPYTSAPESAHILWTKPLVFGGISGGRLGDHIYYTGNSYEQHYIPIVINGLIIFTDRSPDGSTVYGTRCLDLYTGEEVWYLNRTDLAFGQLVLINNLNEHGVLPYLWFGSYGGFFFGGGGGDFDIYDPLTARHLFTIEDVPSGTTTIGPNGEILVYSVSGSTLTMWNSTRAMGATPGSSFTPRGTIDGSNGNEWSVTLENAGGSLSLINPDEGYLLLSSGGGFFASAGASMTHRAYAIPTDYSAPPSPVPQLWSAAREGQGEFRISANIGSGAYALYDAGPNVFTIYSMTDGEVIKTTEPLTSGWATFIYVHHIAYGKLIAIGYDGYIHAYDVTSSSTENDWHYYFGSSAFENAYGSYPTWNGMTIADGKVFVGADEHSQDAIPWRGGKLWVVDVATGELAWEISGWHKVPVISDGIATDLNAIDMQIYAFGKGPSATTISAPDVVVPLGSSIMITGTVTDQTPSSKDTPAISDEWMSAWMEYLYMQKPFPEDATGVEVTLEVTDSNDNTYIIGTTTADNTGAYGFMYTPEIPGNFTVTATFLGSNSYGMSRATTYFSISEAEEPVEIPQYPQYGSNEWPAYPQYTTPELIIIVALVVAIVIGVINLLLVRKRK